MYSAVFLLVAAVLAANGLPQRPSSTAATTAKTTPKPAASDFGLNLTFVLSGINLPTKDDHSEVDAFVKLYSKTGTADEERFGTTTHIQDTKDPKWNEVFWFIWKRGTGQKWHFQVRDRDVLDKDDDVGEVTVDVDEYVDKNQDLTVKLSDMGQLNIKKTQPISFKLYARNVPRMDRLGGKSDPYAEVSWRVGKEGTDTLIGSTAVIDNEDNPDWQETFEFANYQKGTDQYLYFKVLDSDSVSGDDVLGDFLLEVDPYATKRATKITKLNNSDGKATIGITPV